jgi:hypothetical protein
LLVCELCDLKRGNVWGEWLAFGFIFHEGWLHILNQHHSLTVNLTRTDRNP